MDINGRRRSSNIEDRRGSSPQGMNGSYGSSRGGGFFGTYLLMNLLQLLLSTRGGRRVLLILLVLFGLFYFTQGGQGVNSPGQASRITMAEQHRHSGNNSGIGSAVDDTVEKSVPAEAKHSGGNSLDGRLAKASDDEIIDFLSVVLAELEDTWSGIFKQEGMKYREPTLVFYSNYVTSACGNSSSSTGPFYCSADEKVYIDVTFFRELSQRYGASGDFAAAYVLAHEVGHHVQNLLGVLGQSHQLRRQLDEKQANEVSVRVELQADYFAGVWAHYAERENILNVNDIDEAIEAAQAIGDDRLQKQAYGRVVPDSFTHGTSKQRAYWFKQGYLQGTIAFGDNLFSLPYEQLSLPYPHFRSNSNLYNLPLAA